MTESIQFTLPQLNTARAAFWHTNAQPLATLDAATAWIAQMGIVAYAPRPLQFPAPIPSLAEAALGTPAIELSLAQIQPAAELLERLVAAGAAVPLNLTGTLGETPDFIASPQAFAFVFSLRGDKNWRRPPYSTGPAAVAPLAVHIHQILVEHGPLPVLEIVTQAGREVTEAAVLRALGELWAQLRVLPRPQPAGAPTLWELTSNRYTRQLKAGANAGVPMALSTLIAHYLGAVIAATSDEIEVILSPLAARSRIREVLNSLVTTRQIEERSVGGKQLMNVTEGLPHFEPLPEAEPIAVQAFAEPAEPTDSSPRIHSFRSPRPRTDAPRQGGLRPPARRAATFARPWDEERAQRPPRSDDRPPRSEGERRPFVKKFGDKPYGERKPYVKKFGDKPTGERSFAGKKTYAKKFGDKPFGERKPYVKKFGDKPTGERSFAGKKPYAKKFGDKPFGDRKPYVKKFGDKPTGERSFAGKKPYAKKFGDKPFGERKPYVKKFGDKPTGERSFAGKKPYAKKFGDKPFAKKFVDRKPGAKFGASKKFAPRKGKPSSAVRPRKEPEPES